MRKLTAVFVAIILTLLAVSPALAGGPNEFGYNYGARIFVGTGNTWCQVAYKTDATSCAAIMGDFSSDKLVMKWSKAWDDARFGTAPWTTDAWVNNEWNGMNPDGSGWTEIVKIVWVGDCAGPNLRPGGYCIWGSFEALMDQGQSPDGHYWLAHATPTGYGAP